MDGPDVEILLGSSLLGAAGQQEGIAFLSVDVALTAIGVSEKVFFGDGSTR